MQRACIAACLFVPVWVWQMQLAVASLTGERTECFLTEQHVPWRSRTRYWINLVSFGPEFLGTCDSAGRWGWSQLQLQGSLGAPSLQCQNSPDRVCFNLPLACCLSAGVVERVFAGGGGGVCRL